MRRSVAALLCALVLGMIVGSGQASGQPETASSGTAKRTGDPAVGASVVHPAEWVVEREEHTFDGTYGYTLWEPDPSDEDHGGEPEVRVARAPDLKPGQIEARVRERIAAYPDLSLRRTLVPVGDKRHRGVAVGPIPGSTPSIEVYVPVEGRVYQINVYGETLDAEARRLLAGLSFQGPSRSIDSLGLEDGKKSETHQSKGDEELVQREKKAREAARVVLPEGANGTPRTSNLSAPVPGLTEYETLEAAGPPGTQKLALPPYQNEYQIGEGCWVPTSTFFVQTQHGAYANRRWGESWTGWTLAGRPNYWGESTHGSNGYGRCAVPTQTNDMYAIDYPLQSGDVVFSPFSGGTVMFAGRNYSHANYGIFVTIRADNGKYVSMSAHLSGLAAGITKGARVTSSSIIGYAGATGGGLNNSIGEPHLHQAFYRYPSYKPDGAPYGGAGLKVVYHRYTGTAARRAGYAVDPNPYNNVLSYGWTSNTSSNRINCRPGILCGKMYAISD